MDRHEPADGYSSSSPLFPQQCLSPVQAEVTLMKQTNVRPSKPTILRPSKLTNLSPSKQTDSSSSKETDSSQSKQTECKSMKSKPHPLLRKLPKQHPLLRPRESSSDDGEYLDVLPSWTFTSNHLQGSILTRGQVKKKNCQTRL